MARPTKAGLTYFPMDTQFFTDRKIQRLRRACGDKGVIIYIYIISLVYCDKGYYLDWSDDVVIDIANAFSYSENAVKEIVMACVKAELINSDKLDRFHIVTSRGIQERYVESIKSMNRLPVYVQPEYLLIEPQTLPATKFRLTKEQNDVNYNINTVSNIANVVNMAGNDVSSVVKYPVQGSFFDEDGGEYHLAESTLRLVQHLVQVFQKRDKCRLDIRPMELQSLMQLRVQIGGADVDDQINEVVTKFDTLPIFQKGGKFYGWSMLTLLKYKNYDMIKSGMFDVNISKPIKGAGTMTTVVEKPIDDIPF